MKKPLGPKIHIAFLVHTYGFGGLENMVTNLVNHLNPHRFTSTIICFAPLGQLNNRVDINRVQVLSLGKTGGNNPQLIYKIYQILKEIGVDIVQTHNWGTAVEGILGAKLARIQGVIHAERGTIEVKARNIFLQRLLWGVADHVLSVSDAHKKKMTHLIGFPYSKIQAIVNGVDTDRFFPNSEKKEEMRNALGLKKSSLCIGTIGSLRPVKNQSLLIKACQSILPQFEEVEVLIVGEGPLALQLKQEVQALGLTEKIHFSGAQPNIPEILNAVDLFVLPSRSEGMPNAVLEAMSCGVPVIATAVGGVPEVIEHGENGILIASEDEPQLVAALTNLIQNPETRRMLGMKGRQRVLSHFSLKAMVSEYQDLYESLVV